ncbi:related to ring finger protein 14 [Sporisorium reilianum f. sp. reilianum]|uniref:RBR-type E3 ubiquitin transferase n=1 Tax=Sporisorium reilianum f. sp. reilianum TaxID=72559 RepID=A0A2N8UDB7_9BASI|nr:related to ring finger protein 14 [Sporisorium reilianum f. sp. reilianum]
MDAQAILEECRQRQDDEVVALESIFAVPDERSDGQEAQRPSEPRVKLIRNEPEPVLEFYLPVTLPRPTRITVDTYAYEVSGIQAQASSSKHTPSSKEAPKEMTRTSVDQHKKSRHTSNGERRSRNLNATASAFRPGKAAVNKPERIAQLNYNQHSANGTTVDTVATALERVSLDNGDNHEVRAQNGTTSTSQSATPRLRSTKQLQPLTQIAPIVLRVRLPPTYPAEKPPIVESLAAPWLPSAPTAQNPPHAWILRKLDEQYRELSGMEVLYIWATYLSESMWVTLLEEQPPVNDAPSFLQSPDAASESNESSLLFEEHLSSPEAQPLLAAQLLAHSRLCSRTTFDASSFDCAICLETRKGRACTRLTGCGHVFCSECLAGYLSSLVDDGFHRQAKRCPDPECVTLWSEREKQNLVDQEGNLIATQAKTQRLNAKAPSIQGDAGGEEQDKPVVGLVTRSELSSILGPTRLTRLDALTVKAKVEADPSVSYCPRAGCQAPVVRLSSDENSGHWERFRECLSCGFAFCAWCSRSWHGPTSCPVSFQSELIRRYLSLSPSSPDRALMEQKFGRKTLETMVRKYQEEQQTQQWLSDYTTPCPTCGIAIEKSYGCNHMTCKSCQTHYCYLCGKPISAQNPYHHFNVPGWECYHRLFDGLLGDQAPPQQQPEAAGEEGGRGGDGDARPGFALLLDENGIPLHLEPEDQEMDFLAWQQLG